VLRSDRITRGNSSFDTAHRDHASVSQGRTSDVRSREIGQLQGKLTFHACGESRIERNEHGYGVGIVLRLCEEIRRDQAWIGTRVREDDEL